MSDQDTERVRLILQFKLGGKGPWTVLRFFYADETATVQTGAELLSKLCMLYWRIVTDDSRQQVLSIYDGKKWQSVAEANVARRSPLPWTESGGLFGSGMFRRSGDNEFFPTTIQTKFDNN